MSNPPTAPDDGIARLIEDGHEMVLQDEHLVVRRLSYRSPSGPRHDGVLVLPVNTLDGNITDATDHRIWFAGEEPRAENDSALGIPDLHDYGVGVRANYLLSFKPPETLYPSVYAKIRHYSRVLASAIGQTEDPVGPRRTGSFQVVPTDLPLVYPDMNATRVGLITLNNLFRGHTVAIVGVGGTGSYILDQVAKTWVDRIVLIDGDRFETHNAYRAPGAASIDVIRAQPNKAEYFAGEYARMHTGITAHPTALTSENLHLLDGATFVFLAAADAGSRPAIMRYLREREVPFIDVGMSFREGEAGLTGLVKVATFLPEDVVPLPAAPAVPPGEDDYSSNIQVAELNALNAVLAVIRWKRHLGFYATHELSNLTIYKLFLNQIRNGEPDDVD